MNTPFIINLKLPFICAVIFLLYTGQTNAQKDALTYEALWKKVENLKNEGLTQSAIEASEEIAKKAEKEGKGAQRLKALFNVAYFKSLKEEDAFLDAIDDFNEELDNSEEPNKSIVHSILAEIHWWYYNANRWTILQRTHDDEAEDADIQTWSAKKFVEVIDKHYHESIDRGDILSNIEAGEYDDIWIKSEEGRSVRPTLYDVLIHRAIDFYSHQMAGVTEPRDQFFIDDPNYFSTTNDFIDLRIASPDYISFDYKALSLYKTISSFHKVAGNKEAVVYLENERLNFVYRKYSKTDRDTLYEIALRDVIERFSDIEYSTDASAELAGLYAGKASKYHPFNSPEFRWYYKEVLAVCDEAIKRFPKSRGAVQCMEIKENVLRPTHVVNIENVVLPSQSTPYSIRYKNINQLHFRIVSNSANIINLDASRNRPDEIQYFLGKKALREWSVELPDSGDYQLHRVDKLTEGLGTGYYALLASEDKNFKSSENILSLNLFYSSNLAYFFTQGQKSDPVFVVTDRRLGLA